MGTSLRSLVGTIQATAPRSATTVDTQTEVFML